MAGFLENAKMSGETEGLWIELDGSEEHGMFYLASPCKADLTVRKTECNCKEYYGTSNLSAEYVIQEWGVMYALHHRVTRASPSSRIWCMALETLSIFMWISLSLTVLPRTGGRQ